MDEKTGELNQSNTQMVNLNPYFQIDFGKGIYAKTTLGVNINELRQYQYWSALYNPQAQDYNGLGQQYNSKSTVVTWNNIIGWNYKFADKHDISLMLGQEMQRRVISMNIMLNLIFRLLLLVCVTLQLLVLTREMSITSKRRV